jgi:hypothetical protein
LWPFPAGYQSLSGKAALFGQSLPIWGIFCATLIPCSGQVLVSMIQSDSFLVTF